MKSTAERPGTSTRHWRVGVRSIVLLALLGSGVACKPRHKTASPPPAAAEADSTPAEETVAPPPAVPVASATIEVRPACDQYQLTDNGVGAVQVGDPRDAVRSRCIVLSDTTAQQGDGSVRGELVIGVSGSPLVAEIVNDHVYRLEVTDSLFRTMDGLGPGMPVTRLLDLPGAVVLEGVHDLSVVVNAHCGLYFRMPKPATLPENAGRWADIVRAMPPGTPVERVVVHGCRSSATS